MSSDSCNPRHFPWRMKSCFPDSRPNLSTTTVSLHRQITTTISSLPDDLLLELFCRAPPSSLPSLSLVCRRWSSLLDSSTFHELRRRRGHLHNSLFAFSFSDSRLQAAVHTPGVDSSWRTASFSPYDFAYPGCRLAAIGRRIYIIGKTSMLRCDTWTGAITARSKMSVFRKKFAAAVVGGRIYVAGGTTRTSAVEEYDPERNSWRVISNAPRMRYGCIGASANGVFYVIGGLNVGGGTDATRANVFAGSMDLYEVETRRWLRSRAVPGGGCVVAACAAGDYLYILASHAVELSFWRFNGGNTGFGEWSRMKSPPLPAQVRLDSTVRFSCVGVGAEKVVLMQVTGCIDDLLRRSGRSVRGLKKALVLVYEGGEWRRGVDLPEGIRRAACVCAEC